MSPRGILETLLPWSLLLLRKLTRALVPVEHGVSSSWVGQTHDPSQKCHFYVTLVTEPLWPLFTHFRGPLLCPLPQPPTYSEILPTVQRALRGTGLAARCG